MSIKEINPLIVVVTVLILALGSRYYFQERDFSAFFVAGSEFAGKSTSAVPVKIFDGPGYDGQFFYHYALDPLGNTAKSGISPDHDAYRHQRILYPLLAWLMSFGRAEFVPFSLVLINFLCFMLSCVVFNMFCSELGINKWYAVIPLFISGILMALGRDLSEVVEVFLVLLAFWSFYRRRYLTFAMAVTLSLLNRDSSAILLLPLLAISFIRSWSDRRYSRVSLLLIPLTVIVLWKLFIFNHYHSGFMAGEFFTIPFFAIFQGLILGFRSVKSIPGFLEYAMWLMFLTWNVLLATIVFNTCDLTKKSASDFESSLRWSWILGLIASISFSYSIYVDDWSFVRVLSGFNAISFLLLLVKRHFIPKSLIVFSLLLALLTIFRLAIRP